MLPLARWLLHRGIGVRFLSHTRAEAWLSEENLLEQGATFSSCGEFSLLLQQMHVDLVSAPNDLEGCQRLRDTYAAEFAKRLSACFSLFAHSGWLLAGVGLQQKLGCAPNGRNGLP